MKTTLNSQVYNKALRNNFGCPICGPNKGCNRKRTHDSYCWKSNRKDQWRE